MDYRDETIEKEDFYQMYLDDLSEITPCTEAEREELLEKLLLGEEAAKKRLIEGHLQAVLEMASDYMEGPLPAGDLIQEANVALMLAADSYEGGDFLSHLRAQVEEALKFGSGGTEAGRRNQRRDYSQSQCASGSFQSNGKRTGKGSDCRRTGRKDENDSGGN